MATNDTTSPTARQWAPTHRIFHDGRVTLVMADDSVGDGPEVVLYTREEWEAESGADWELHEDGDAHYQGWVVGYPIEPIGGRR